MSGSVPKVPCMKKAVASSTSTGPETSGSTNCFFAVGRSSFTCKSICCVFNFCFLLRVQHFVAFGLPLGAALLTTAQVLSATAAWSLSQSQCVSISELRRETNQQRFPRESHLLCPSPPFGPIPFSCSPDSI